MTGYKKEEILGKNCRFLQSPDGNVTPGSIRKHSDNTVISHMKSNIESRKEWQYSLVNYKKNGEPFINLVTIIPVCFGEDGIVTHFIGFQMDLIDQPDAILRKSPNGTYSVNYQKQERLVHSIPLPPVQDSPELEKIIYSPKMPFQSPVLSRFEFAPSNSTGDSTLDDSTELMHSAISSIPMFQSKFVDNCGDFVHILSIRGLFLYVSPTACRDLFEYQPDELLAHNISEFLHPSDLVFVLRELRSANPTDLINIVCRFRKKDGSYLYMEMRGHVYGGDGSKRTRCIIMSGREKKAGLMLANDILIPEVGRTESWAKISPEGLFLYNCPITAELFGYLPEQMFSTCLYEYVHEDDRHRLKIAIDYTMNGSRFFDVPSLTLFSAGGNIIVHLRIYNDGEASPKYLFCQFKLLVDISGNSFPVDLKTMNSYSGLYTDGNIFDFLRNEKSSSMGYEINQLRLENKKLREELESQMQIKSPVLSNNRDRSVRSESSNSTSNSNTTCVNGMNDDMNLVPSNKQETMPFIQFDENENVL